MIVEFEESIVVGIGLITELDQERGKQPAAVLLLVLPEITIESHKKRHFMQFPLRSEGISIPAITAVPDYSLAECRIVMTRYQSGSRWPLLPHSNMASPACIEFHSTTWLVLFQIRALNLLHSTSAWHSNRTAPPVLV